MHVALVWAQAVHLMQLASMTRARTGRFVPPHMAYRAFTNCPRSATPAMTAPAWHSYSVAELNETFL